MFFILILLIIAFATILRVESYDVKKMLPKLLIMAVLINFSKTIFGLLIDFSQVVMLTFVNGFSQNGAGNFISMFQTGDIMKMWKGADISAWSTVVAVIAGVIALIITNIVVLVMLAILVMRIIMLWIYTILSPIVFLGFAFPPIQKYTGQIWEDFNKQLVVGPVLAFFLWLALATASESSNKIAANLTTSGEVCVGVGKLFCTGSFQTFIITIGLLMGGMMVAQQMGGAAASIAGKGVGWAKKTLTAGGTALASPLLGAKALANFGVDKLHQKTGVDLNLPRAWKTLQDRRAVIRQQRYAEGMQKAGQVMAEGTSLHGVLAMTGSPGDAWNQITSLKGIRQRIMGGKYMAKERKKYQREIDKPKEELEALESRRREVLTFTEKEDLKNKSKGKIGAIDSEIAKKKAKHAKAVAAGKDEDAERLESEIGGLENDRDRERENLKAIRSRPVANAEAADLDKKIADKSQELDAARKEYQPKIDKNVPMYNFEAKAAENKAVGEEASKIKDIDDASELVRMLKGAIAAKEKSRIKAIMRKLTADYNDNEAFEALVPEAGSGYEGLQTFMDELSTKGSRNYAGFDKQEAYSLGAQVAEMNKKTNHWEATAAYEMKDGQWEKTDARRHAEIASTEFGKNAPRANARNFNRLAMGKHIVDPVTGEKRYELADTGLIALQSWDNPVNIDRMLEDMTESTAKYIVPFLDKLEEQGFFKATGPKKIGEFEHPTLADVIRIKANEAKVNFDEQFANVTGIREAINKKT